MGWVSSCQSQLVKFQESYESVAIKPVAWNWPWGKYLHHQNWQTAHRSGPPNLWRSGCQTGASMPSTGLWKILSIKKIAQHMTSHYMKTFCVFCLKPLKFFERPFILKRFFLACLSSESDVFCFWHLSNNQPPPKNKTASIIYRMYASSFPEYFPGLVLSSWVFNDSQRLRWTGLPYYQVTAVFVTCLWLWFCTFCPVTSPRSLSSGCYCSLAIFWNFPGSLFITMSLLTEVIWWGTGWVRNNFKRWDKKRQWPPENPNWWYSLGGSWLADRLACLDAEVLAIHSALTF